MINAIPFIRYGYRFAFLVNLHEISISLFEKSNNLCIPSAYVCVTPGPFKLFSTLYGVVCR